MIRLLTTSIVTLVLFLAGCSNGSKTESNEPSTSSTQTPAQTTGSPKGEALVTALPAGIEGVELAEGGLRLLDGYEFVKDSDSTFYVARINTGRPSTPKPGGGCKCSSGSGSCSPVLRGGIIVCEASDTLCTKCGLGVTLGGTTTTLFLY